MIKPSAEQVAEIVARILKKGRGGGGIADIPLSGPLYAALRRKGRKRHATWVWEEDLATALATLIEGAPGVAFDAIELFLSGEDRVVQPADFTRLLAPRHRGLRGIDIDYQGDVERLAPTEMIATNRDFKRAFHRYLDQRGLDERAFWAGGGTIRRFDGAQYLVLAGPRVRAVSLFRGNRVVPPEAITGETIADMIATMGDWLVRHVDERGRMTYKYWPSRGEESRANNTIRQFMATVALGRLAACRGDRRTRAAAERNLAYNLEQFFRVEDGVGMIEYDGSAKLGAAALAALAILEAPEGRSRFAAVFNALVRGIDTLWLENGAFRTFHKPPDRNDNHNFYPGEALLFWAHLHRRTGDREIRRKALLSFQTYRDWHRNNRNPAFIPWHTQAYRLLYEDTAITELREFVFEMNDWLLPMQQWESAPAPDLMGRFHDPKHPNYGPPHASSTGVYLEGLADALYLAETANDAGRAARYRTAIRRGLRSARQLQFLDEIDMFYISRRDAVHGGLRTETYNNEIRVDNVQHNLMALLRLQELEKQGYGLEDRQSPASIGQRQPGPVTPACGRAARRCRRSVMQPVKILDHALIFRAQRVERGTPFLHRDIGQGLRLRQQARQLPGTDIGGGTLEGVRGLAPRLATVSDCLFQTAGVALRHRLEQTDHLAFQLDIPFGVRAKLAKIDGVSPG